MSHFPSLLSSFRSNLNLGWISKSKLMCRRNIINQKCFSISNENQQIIKPFNILFFGTDNISLKTLKILRKNQNFPEETPTPKVVNHLEVVCMKELFPSLICPVKKFSVEDGIKVHHPFPSLKEWQVPSPEFSSKQADSSRKFDLAIVVSFGHLIPSKIIDSFPLGGINMHPSLLPKFRGAAPIIHTVLSGDKVIGYSIIELSRNKFDVGRVLLQKEIDLGDRNERITSEELAEELGKEGSEGILQTLNEFMIRKISALEQESYGIKASFAPKPKRNDGFIRWSEQTNEEIFRMWRAYSGIIGIHTKFNLNGEEIKVVEMLPPTQRISYQNQEEWEETYKPGMLKYDVSQKAIFVKCKKGWIGITHLHAAGHKARDAEKFAIGYRFLSEKEPNPLFSFGTIDN